MKTHIRKLCDEWYIKGRVDTIDYIVELADCKRANCFDCAFYDCAGGCKLNTIIIRGWDDER